MNDANTVLPEDKESQTAAREEGDDRSPGSAQTIAQVTLAVLAVFYALSVSADILLPLLLALVFKLLLQPAMRFLCERLHLPAGLAALVLILALFSVVAGIGFAISVPAFGWIAKGPQGLATIEERLSIVRGPISFVRHGMDQLDQMVQQSPREGVPAPVAVQSPSQLPGVGLSILLGTQHFFGRLFILVLVLFFLLASGDSFLRKLVEVVPTFRDKRRVVVIANEIERNVSGYLVTITVMNALVGIANGVSMYLCGMPDPLLWGTVAFLLNYVPILGPLTGLAIFFVVGLLSFDTLWHAFIPAGIYLAIHGIEGQTVTPLLLARRFTLNPVIVIVSLFFWDWLWGIPGALLSVPLLAIFKIVSDRIPVLMPLGHILGASERRYAVPRRAVA